MSLKYLLAKTAQLPLLLTAVSLCVFGIANLSAQNLDDIRQLLNNSTQVKKSKLGEQKSGGSIPMSRDPRIYRGEKRIESGLPPTFVWSDELQIMRDWSDEEWNCQVHYNANHRDWRYRRHTLLEYRDAMYNHMKTYEQSIALQIQESNASFAMAFTEITDRIYELNKTCKINDDSNRVRITRKMAEEAKARQDKENDLAELRAGLFCSQCERSRTQLAKQGIEFYNHVREVKGKVIALAPEKIAKKAQEWDRIIENIRKSYDPSLIKKRLDDQLSCFEKRNRLDSILWHIRTKNVEEINQLNKNSWEARKRFDREMNSWNQEWREHFQSQSIIEQKSQQCMQQASLRRDKRLAGLKQSREN